MFRDLKKKQCCNFFLCFQLVIHFSMVRTVPTDVTVGLDHYAVTLSPAVCVTLGGAGPSVRWTRTSVVRQSTPVPRRLTLSV